MVIKEQPIIQFIHQYDYDADNRIRLVHISSDGYVWNKEADYDYYLHGPLSRTELGHYRVQGLDYHYTLQGWIKGVNMPYAGDPGADGLNGNKTGKDVFAYTLGYFYGDYLPITADWIQQPDNRDKLWHRAVENIQHGGLYNGNISWMETDLPSIGAKNNDRTKGLQTMLYRYDQLHRITRSRSLTSYQVGYGWQQRGEQGAYDENYTYDANGNIMTLKRNDELATLKDDFVYDYYAGTNKLKNVKATPTQNYSYDAIGNLINDAEEGVTISWTPYGKVRSVQKGDSVTTSYRYDASGNRVEIKVVKTDTTFITRYLRDASGNVMSIYKDTTTSETPIYGSARLGQYKGGVVEGHRTLGHRSYELSNHLGNVLAVITDNINMQPTGTNADSTVWATVLNTSDYYPFGLEMKGRSATGTTASAYRYGFNGKEKDNFNATVYDYGFRIYNPEIGKFLSVDPLTKTYAMLTPYQFASNTPLQAIDLDGMEAKAVTKITDNFKKSEGYEIVFSRVTMESVIHINYFSEYNVRNITGISHIPDTHEVKHDLVTGTFTSYSINLNSNGEITAVSKVKFKQSGTRNFPETSIGEAFNLTEIFSVKEIHKEFDISGVKINPNKLTSNEVIKDDPLSLILQNPIVKTYSKLVNERKDLLRNNDVPYLSTANKAEEITGGAIEFVTEVVPADIVHYNGVTIMNVPFKEETKAVQEMKKAIVAPKMQE